MIGPFCRQGPAATLGQHCPQMTQRPGTSILPPIENNDHAARHFVAPDFISFVLHGRRGDVIQNATIQVMIQVA